MTEYSEPDDKILNEVYDNYVESLIDEQIDQNRVHVNAELQNKIPFTNIYTNTVNVAVGKQRLGKTRLLLKEIVKISNQHPETHLLIYSNKDGAASDDTFESMKKLINIPIEYVAHDKLDSFMKNLLAYKQLYKTIKREHLENKIIDEQAEQLFNILHIDSFTQNYLHTLILVDDLVKSPLIKSQYFNTLITQCAHIGCSFFIAVQYWTALSNTLKSQASTIFIFGGFSNQQMHVMLYQVTLSDPFDIVFSKYRQLKPHGVLVVDLISGNYQMIS